MSARSQCDVLVSGLSLSGLIVANLLQRRGHTVIVVHDENDVPRRITTGPSLFLGFEKGGLYDTIFSELDVSLSTMKQEGTFIETLSPYLQIVLPNQRINLFSTREEFLCEVTRELHITEETVRAFCDEIDRLYERVAPFFWPLSHTRLATSHTQRGSLADKIRSLSTFYAARRRKGDFYPRKYLDNSLLITCLDLLVLCFSKATLHEASSLTLIILLSLLGREVVRIHGGSPHLRHFLLQTFLSHNGETRSYSRISDILIESSTVRSVEWERKEKIECGSLILSMPERSPRRFASLRFEIDRDVLPPLMREYLLLCRDVAAPPFGGNLLFLSLGSRTEKGNPLPERQEMTVSCLVEEQSTQEGYYREKLQKKVMEAIRWLIPFSSGKIRCVGDDLSETPSQDAVSRHLLKDVKRVEKGGSLYLRSGRLRNLFLLPDQGNYLIGGIKDAATGIELSNALSTPHSPSPFP